MHGGKNSLLPNEIIDEKATTREKKKEREREGGVLLLPNCTIAKG